jgi:hypothetical protein
LNFSPFGAAAAASSAQCEPRHTVEASLRSHSGGSTQKAGQRQESSCSRLPATGRRSSSSGATNNNNNDDINSNINETSRIAL